MRLLLPTTEPKEVGGGVVWQKRIHVHVPTPVHALTLGMLGVISASSAGVLLSSAPFCF